MENRCRWGAELLGRVFQHCIAWRGLHTGSAIPAARAFRSKGLDIVRPPLVARRCPVSAERASAQRRARGPVRSLEVPTGRLAGPPLPLSRGQGQPPVGPV